MSDTRENRKPRRQRNGWKWAFFILLVAILALFGWLVYRLQPVEQDNESSEVVSRVETEGVLTFDLSTNKDDLNHLVNLYLEEELGEEFEGYSVSIDEFVDLAGTIDVLGFPVQFTLIMEPLVMENGDLQLKAESIQLGSFDLPLSLTMNILSQQLDLPEWMRVNSEDEYILVAFNEFQLENGAYFQMDYIDLEDDDIRLTIFLPEEAI
ncbi:hypothetical protein GCM10008932_24450 [Alkalibacterium iburiense]|uniref:DUF2140 family protein n=1 Tax=Alkalibacterium iburiense TaxID=290589 RepID=A0ABN0XU34_9LACT